MGLALKCARQTKAETWQYRRRISTAVRNLLDEGEFKRFLGATRTEAMKAYPRIDAEFDRLVVEAARLAVKPPKPDGPLEIHRAAQRLAEQRGKHPVFVGGREVAEDHPDAATFFVNITSPAFRRS